MAREMMSRAWQTDGEQAVGGVHVDAALGHERAGDADLRLLAEDPELLRGALANRAVPREDDRASRRPDQLESLIHDLVGGNGPAQAVHGERLRGRVVLGDILGQFDVGRARLLGAGEPHRLAHHLGDVVRPDYLVGPLRNRPEHRHHVHDLVRFLVQPVRRSLSRQDQHRGT